MVTDDAMSATFNTGNYTNIISHLKFQQHSKLANIYIYIYIAIHNTASCLCYYNCHCYIYIYSKQYST